MRTVSLSRSPSRTTSCPRSRSFHRSNALVVIEHEVTTNPLGIKGAGEAGMLGATAAVANAVADALGGEANVVALPLTPERIRAMLRPR